MFVSDFLVLQYYLHLSLSISWPGRMLLSEALTDEPDLSLVPPIRVPVALIRILGYFVDSKQLRAFWSPSHFLALVLVYTKHSVCLLPVKCNIS